MLKPPDLDPHAVRAQFSRRAARFADVDFLHREIEQRMFDRLELIKVAPQQIVDIGCGLGGGLATLAARYPTAQVVGIDASDRMLALNRFAPTLRAGASLAQRLRRWAERLTGAAGSPSTASSSGASAAVGPAQAVSAELASRVSLVLADAGRLPLPSTRVDLLWSNLAWHWFDDPPAVAAEWHRVLKPGGLLMFCSFGVDTLRELRQLGAPIPEFPDLHDVGDLLGQSGFMDPVMDVERLTIRYKDAGRLLEEWHAIGGNASRQRQRGLATPAQKRRWIEAIESQRGPDGEIALSIEIVHAHAWRGENKAPDGYQTIQFQPRSAATRARQTRKPPGSTPPERP